MAKKYGFDPFILLTMETPQPTTVVGGGSGQGGHSPFPMSFSAWSESPFADDYDLDGNDGTEEDYKQWWQNCGFTKEQWETVNPGVPWPFGGEQP